MTLKQFLQLASGALVSLLFYASPLNPILKWPLIVITFLMGVALAFLPIEERPLSTWIFIFFRSIYSPTRFAWKKLTPGYSYFITEEELRAPNKGLAKQPEPPKKDEFAAPVLITKDPFIINLEEKENAFLNKVQETLINPNTSVLINKMVVDSGMSSPTIYQPEQKSPAGIVNTVVQNAKVSQVAPVQIPQSSPTGVTGYTGYQTPQNATQGSGSSVITTSTVLPSSAPAQIPESKSVQFSPEASPPLIPNKPNVISGQVIDVNKQIIDGAIIEIKDENGRPVRALKSNKLGHFMTITPLLDGKYIVVTEKDGVVFEPVNFFAEGKIIPPIAIIGTLEIPKHGSIAIN